MFWLCAWMIGLEQVTTQMSFIKTCKIHYLAKSPQFSKNTGSNVAMVEIAHFMDRVDQNSWKNFQWSLTLEI